MNTTIDLCHKPKRHESKNRFMSDKPKRHENKNKLMSEKPMRHEYKHKLMSDNQNDMKTEISLCQINFMSLWFV
jgi:hypothetical protein